MSIQEHLNKLRDDLLAAVEAEEGDKIEFLENSIAKLKAAVERAIQESQQKGATDVL